MRWWRTWPDLSLRTKCLLLILFPATATVLMFAVANLLAARNSAAADVANRSLEIRAEIQRLRAADLETSSDVRAYFITAQEPFATQTRFALASFDAARQQLFTLTADNPRQQQQLAQIASIGHAHEERLFGDMARFRSGVLPWDQVRTGLGEVEAERLQMENLLKPVDQDNSLRLET